MSQQFELGFERARVSLKACGDSLARLADGTDEDAVFSAWAEFLKHYTGCVAAMRRASSSGSLKRWSDKLLNEQREDGILSYLLHARNAEEHGLAFVARPNSSRVRLGPLTFFNCVCDDAVIEGNVQYGERLDEFRGSITTDGRKFCGHWEGNLRPQGVAGWVDLAPVIDRGVRYEVPELTIDAVYPLYLRIAKYTLGWLSRKISDLLSLKQQE